MTAVTMTENKDNNITAPLMHMCNVHQRSCLLFSIDTNKKAHEQNVHELFQVGRSDGT